MSFTTAAPLRYPGGRERRANKVRPYGPNPYSPYGPNPYSPYGPNPYSGIDFSVGN